MRVLFDPIADAAMDAAWSRSEPLGQRLEEAIDWIEADDVRARRRRFTNGLYAIAVHAIGQDWTILWEPTEGVTATTRFVGETTSI